MGSNGFWTYLVQKTVSPELADASLAFWLLIVFLVKKKKNQQEIVENLFFLFLSSEDGVCLSNSPTYVCSQSLSHILLSVTPWTEALQAPLSMGFPRQGYQNGLPFPPPGDLPDSGIKHVSTASVALAC